MITKVSALFDVLFRRDRITVGVRACSPVFLLCAQAEWSRICCRQRGRLRSGVSGAVDPACISTAQHPVWQWLRSRLLPGCDRGLCSLRRPQRTITPPFRPPPDCVFFLPSVSPHVTVHVTDYLGCSWGETFTFCLWVIQSETSSGQRSSRGRKYSDKWKQ